MAFDEKSYQKEYRERNKEKLRAYKAAYRQKYATKVASAISNWKSDNRERVKEYERQYRKRRREKGLKFPHESTVETKLRSILRNRIWDALKGQRKLGSAVKDLGCSVLELKKHLESKFQVGMTWDNYGDWHVDHILPLSKFDLADLAQFKKAVHFSNLQPLWAADNIKKSNK